MTTEHPIVNGSEAEFGKRVFLMWAGAYGDAKGYVFADSEDDAFEAWVEYLDENAPGCLVSHEAFRDLLNEAAREHGFKDFAAAETVLGSASDAFGDIYKIVEDAEVDLTVIGHTSLKHGSHIASHEWGLDEITDGDDVVAAAIVESHDAPEFNREDITAAWNLYLPMVWASQGAREYVRWCKLRKWFKPRRSQETAAGLGYNAQAILARLMTTGPHAR